jgi:hypothetical protein
MVQIDGGVGVEKARGENAVLCQQMRWRPGARSKATGPAGQKTGVVCDRKKQTLTRNRWPPPTLEVDRTGGTAKKGNVSAREKAKAGDSVCCGEEQLSTGRYAAGRGEPRAENRGAAAAPPFRLVSWRCQTERRLACCLREVGSIDLGWGATGRP